MPSGWELSNAQLHLSHFCFKSVFQDFSRLGLNGRLLIPAFYIYLTATLRVAGLQMQAGNDVQLQAEILFQNVYGRGLSPNITKPISKYLSWCVCAPSILTIQFLFALLYLSSPPVFYLSCLRACWQTKVHFCFMRLNGIVPAVMCEANHSWRTCSHTMDYHMIPPEQTLNRNIP